MYIFEKGGRALGNLISGISAGIAYFGFLLLLIWFAFSRKESAKQMDEILKAKAFARGTNGGTNGWGPGGWSSR